MGSQPVLVIRRMLAYGTLLLCATACSGGGDSPTSSIVPQTEQTLKPTATSAPVSTATSPLPNTSTASDTNSTQDLCIDGTQYRTTEDDEFSNDTMLSSMWNTQLPWGRTNNAGTDDAFYTDPSAGFGGYNPVSFNNGALNITAKPVPANYANATALTANAAQRHWLSGALSGPPQKYGYIEVSAKEPNLQGFWPAPLWLWGTSGLQPFSAPNFQELDVNELFGNAYAKSTVQQTMLYGYGAPVNGIPVRTVVNPDPSTTFHTYGVLWTQGNPGTVTFYIDRQAATPTYAAQSAWPMVPIINLQVFAAGTWAPPPSSETPQSMSLQYFRWYQTTNSSCGPSIIEANASGILETPSAVGAHPF